MVKDQVDQLHEDAADGSGRVMALAPHPFVTGQAFRAEYLDLALEYDAIAGHYLATAPARAGTTAPTTAQRPAAAAV